MASSPINLFFERYPRFNHSPTNEAWSEYHRMVHSLGWKEKSKREKVARKRFRVAVVEQFGQMYGTDENNLNSLQRLSEKLHISPVPDSIKSCKKAIEKVHVNIMDFVDSERTGDPVVTFKNPKRFREYTVATGKIFPKKEAKESSLLSASWESASRLPAGKLATVACTSEVVPQEGRTSSSTRGKRLKDEGTKLQVVAAGATAGLVSRFIVAPLDVVKIRLQLQPYSLSDPLTPLRSAPAYRGTVATLNHILKHEGLTALWKGNVPAELLYVCYASIQFTTYRATTQFLQTALPTRLPDAAESFIAGASSGALATTITYPLDLLRTRFAAQGRRRIYSSLRGAISDIKRDEGFRGFFRGIGPGIGQIVPFMGIFFVAYEGLRVKMAGLNMPWGSGDATAGVIGSVIAKTSIFPLDLVRKRIQVQGPTRGNYVYGDIPEYSSAFRAISSIVRTEGFRGLYKGLPISLIKSAPASAITVWTYERSLRMIMGLDSEEAKL